MKELFSLLEKASTNELHLFRSRKNDGKCYLKENKSICGKMNKDEKQHLEFVCKDKKQSREKCAEIGEYVCGTCVSHLYAKY